MLQFVPGYIASFSSFTEFKKETIIASSQDHKLNAVGELFCRLA